MQSFANFVCVQRMCPIWQSWTEVQCIQDQAALHRSLGACVTEVPSDASFRQHVERQEDSRFVVREFASNDEHRQGLFAAAAASCDKSGTSSLVESSPQRLDAHPTFIQQFLSAHFVLHEWSSAFISGFSCFPDFVFECK